MTREATTPNVMEGDRIERLLGELRASSGPQVWPRVEELMCELMQLYSRGLERIVGELGEESRRRLLDDELVAGLLALHGLHPLPVETRIKDALDQVAAQIGPVELVSLEGGVARLRAADAPRLDGAGELIERLLIEAAPEIARVEVAGLRTPQAGGLVQIDLMRSRVSR